MRGISHEPLLRIDVLGDAVDHVVKGASNAGYLVAAKGKSHAAAPPEVARRDGFRGAGQFVQRAQDDPRQPQTAKHANDCAEHDAEHQIEAPTGSNVVGGPERSYLFDVVFVRLGDYDAGLCGCLWGFSVQR